MIRVVSALIVIGVPVLLVIIPDHILHAPIPITLEHLIIGGFVVLLAYLIRRNIRFNRRQNGERKFFGTKNSKIY